MDVVDANDTNMPPAGALTHVRKSVSVDTTVSELEPRFPGTSPY